MLNQIITNKKIDTLIKLENIIEGRKIIEDNKILKIKKGVMIRKKLKEFKEEKQEELEEKIRLLMLKNIYFEDVDKNEEAKKARKITRKYMKEIDSFETKIINIKELMIGTTNYDCNMLKKK